MRTAIIAAVASMAFGFAFAQNANSPAPPNDPGRTALPRIDLAPAQSTEPGNPAIKLKEGNNPGAPAAGANSFTETQAKSRIESRGYSDVSALTKGANGIWQGTAMKDGKAVQVSLDFQGNVVAN
jgi:hypothetical protein